ncbi:hypothetical protein FKR81_03835 [Lentzea tibetensis]|uniref:Uncharacterized protein n=1 Tax=Lentzea tibetensis TaxID=2591470 RepID=A0A563F1P4_9PSEU|nr:hypothetical protein [Lentzea tibetensis]TWP53895.1 hypothetical protein FKR81_03835 [Lentzea tibetensis]
MLPNTVDVEARMRRLAALVQTSNSLITTLSTWLGTQVAHQLIDTRRRGITLQEARKLDLGAGTPLPYRQGELWARLGGSPVRIATANALVVTRRMPREVVEQIQRVPLGFALQPHGVYRRPDTSVCAPTHDAHRGPRLTLRLTAVLVVNGRPWALTDETIDQVVVEHTAERPQDSVG